MKAPALGSCFMGLAWVGPSIIEYGTEEQKQQFIPDILDGKYQWCTGYSEPDSGSDLGSSVQGAVREGDDYVVNGQKIWTSIAMWSKWMILLVRTERRSESTSTKGITCLLVPMDSEGITVRPIKNMSGGAMFAEVFFDDVRVPVENRLGEEGAGLAGDHLRPGPRALGHRRGLRPPDAQAGRGLKDLARRDEEERSARRIDIPAVRAAPSWQRAEIRIEAMRLNGLRFLTKQLRASPWAARPRSTSSTAPRSRSSSASWRWRSRARRARPDGGRRGGS